MSLFTFPDFTSLQNVLSKRMISRIEQSITQQGQASIVLSGGSTPKPLYQHLASHSIDWDKLYITLSDERWVSPLSPDSNIAMIRSQLIRENKQAHFVSLTPSEEVWVKGEPSISSHIQQLRSNIDALNHPYAFTLVGMGEDGHTASLFPCAPELELGLTSNHALVECNPTTAAHKRITMTRQELLNSELILILIRGEKKFAVMENAISIASCWKQPIYALLEPEKVNKALNIPQRNKIPATEIYWCP